MTFVSPFDNYHVIAGQGVIAKELIEEVGQLDHMLMAVGGGGLISGCCIAARELSPGCKMWGCEPEVAPDAKESLEKGEIVSIMP